MVATNKFAFDPPVVWKDGGIKLPSQKQPPGDPNDPKFDDQITDYLDSRSIDSATTMKNGD